MKSGEKIILDFSVKKTQQGQMYQVTVEIKNFLYLSI